MKEMDNREKSRKCPSCGHALRINDDGTCHECGAQGSAVDQTPIWPRFLSLPPMRYQNAYVWLVFISVLDVILTMLVLYVWEGHEVNPIAAAIIMHLGFRWTIAFKLALIVLVIVICEVVGRKHDTLGKQLALASVAIAAFPVAYTFALLFQAGPVTDKEVEEAVAALRWIGFFV